MVRALRAPVSSYPVGGDCCPDVPGLTPGALSEVGVDEGEVKVGAASPGLGVDLLHQPLQLLEGGVQPGVDLQLVSRGVTWRSSVTCNTTMIGINPVTRVHFYTLYGYQKPDLGVN